MSDPWVPVTYAPGVIWVEHEGAADGDDWRSMVATDGTTFYLRGDPAKDAEVLTLHTEMGKRYARLLAESLADTKPLPPS